MTRKQGVVVAAAVLVVVVVGLIWWLSRPAPAPEPVVTATLVPTARPTPTPTPEAEPEPEVGDVGAAPPLRVEIPRVGVDLDVLPIQPSGGVIDPPTMAEAYWIESYGAPGTDATNTVYLAAHSSLHHEDAAFNPLLDVEHQESVLAPGDEVRVTTANGVLLYEVTGSIRYGKRELPDAREVWLIEPDVLHLITCFQQDGLARAEDNLVVTARLVAGFPSAGG